MNLHHVVAVRLLRFTPENANAVTICFESAERYSRFNVTVFDLPDAAAKALADALRSLTTVEEPETV